VLCKSHNERLSILDDEAIKAFKIVRKECELNAMRTEMKPRYWTIHRWHVSGPLLERFLKNLIGLACEGHRNIGPDSTAAGQPSPKFNLVELPMAWRNFRECPGFTLWRPPK
jgi:hypothetical protein